MIKKKEKTWKKAQFKSLMTEINIKKHAVSFMVTEQELRMQFYNNDYELHKETETGSWGHSLNSSN